MKPARLVQRKGQSPAASISVVSEVLRSIVEHGKKTLILQWRYPRLLRAPSSSMRLQDES